MTNENMLTTPSIIKRIEQTELNEVCKVIADCRVLPVNLIRAFLKKRGKKDGQIDNILNQIVKRKLAFYDETCTYLKLNKAFSSVDINQGYIKSLWLMLDLIDNVDEYFIQNKTPHTLTFFNSNAEQSGLSPVYDVFFIPYDSEKINEYVVNNLSVSSNEPLNCFVILEAESQISKLHFGENVNVVSYVIVSSDGTVQYVKAQEGEKNE